jgi:hypothetical protein
MAPQFSTKGFSNCCITRTPPSPDGLAPRPAISPARLVHKVVSKDHIPSWDTIDTAELHAIFEDGADSEEEDGQFKSQTKVKVESLLQADIPDPELKCLDLRIKKSSSTLQLVSEKLRKHLSTSAHPKRYSRSSVGTSDQEIERRAELRRIREKRIREELSNEDVYDDDAKSIPSVNDELSQRAPPTMLVSRDTGMYIPPLGLKTPALQYPSLSFPHLSPFDQ